jgi:hypothetical protein
MEPNQSSGWRYPTHYRRIDMSMTIFIQVGISEEDRNRMEQIPAAKAAYEKLIGECDTPYGAYVRIDASQYPEEALGGYVETLELFGIDPIVTIFEPREWGNYMTPSDVIACHRLLEEVEAQSEDENSEAD